MCVTTTTCRSVWLEQLYEGFNKNEREQSRQRAEGDRHRKGERLVFLSYMSVCNTRTPRRDTPKMTDLAGLVFVGWRLVWHQGRGWRTVRARHWGACAKRSAASEEGETKYSSCQKIPRAFRPVNSSWEDTRHRLWSHTGPVLGQKRGATTDADSRKFPQEKKPYPGAAKQHRHQNRCTILSVTRRRADTKTAAPPKKKITRTPHQRPNVSAGK